VTTRSKLAALAALCAVLLAAGCGGSQPAPRSASPATVSVRQEYEGGSLYMEGSYSYVRVEQNGRSVTQVRLSNERVPRATISLDPGTYRLISFQRPCDGNCSRLDPPTDRCSRELEAKAGERVEATVQLRPGDGCTIDANA
jgi:hypothetical protein